MPETLLEQNDGSGGGTRDSTPPLVREPLQDRSRRTLKRILDAALHLLEREGPAALTVTGITKRARTSVGSFYARFQGKDDLLRYMGERSLEEALDRWAQSASRLSAGEQLRTSVGEVVHALGWVYLEGPGRSLVLLNGIEDPRPTRRRRLENRIAADLRELEVASPLRTDLATRVLAGILQDSAMRALKNTTQTDEDSPYTETHVLLPELVELLVGYLGGEVGSPADAGPTPAAEPAPPDLKPEVVTEEPVEPTQEIDTDALIEAALATAPLSPAEPSGVEHPSEAAQRPAEGIPAAPAPGAEPEGAQEEELEPEEEEQDEESEHDAEPPPDPDPFDVWG